MLHGRHIERSNHHLIGARSCGSVFSCNLAPETHESPLVFLSVRTHAINGRRWFWSCLVFLLSSATAPYAFVSVRCTYTLSLELTFWEGCFAISKVPAVQWVRSTPRAWVLRRTNEYVSP